MTAPADGPTPLPRRQPDEEPTPPLGNAAPGLPNDPTPPQGPLAPVQGVQPQGQGGIHSPVTGGGDVCANCGSSLAPDQRYCLACGQRRGDPRLPFMDAVVFMDAAKHPQTLAPPAPPSPPDKRPFMSANASLVAGVATLVLAIGVGVLIGRSGEGDSGSANQTPQIIRVGGSGGEAETGTGTEAGGAGSAESTANQPKSKTQAKAKEKTKTGSSGTSKATEEAYKPKAGVKLAPPEQKLGGKCDPSVKGCSKSGEFDGSFFE